jgi:hypothetical protein
LFILIHENKMKNKMEQEILHLSPDSPTGISAENWTAPQTAIDLKPAAGLDRVGRAVLEQSCTAGNLLPFKGMRVEIYGYLVTIKPVRTVRGDRMNFGCFIDHEGHFLDTIHFPPSLVHSPFRGVGVYRLSGKVVDEFGFLSLEVTEMVKMPRKTDPRAAKG